MILVNSNNLVQRKLLQTLEENNLNDVIQQKLLRKQNHELNITDDIELDLVETEARSSFRHPLTSSLSLSKTAMSNR